MSRSSLGYGFPPDSPHYVRTTDDFDVPPLVGGRPVRMREGCALCEVGGNLYAGGMSREWAAWAEHDLAYALYTGEVAEDAIKAFRSAWGVRFTKTDYERHRKEHVPSVMSAKLDTLAGLESGEFDDHSWREIFDGLHLGVMHMKSSLASGELRPTMAEGLQAAKLLSDLMSVTIADKNEKDDGGLRTMFAFVSGVREIIDREIDDPGLKERVHEAIAAHTNAMLEEVQGAGSEPAYPRGRAGDPKREDEETDDGESRGGQKS